MKQVLNPNSMDFTNSFSKLKFYYVKNFDLWFFRLPVYIKIVIWKDRKS